MEKLYLVTLDLQKQELVSSVVIDEIDHSEPTRMTDLYFYPNNRAVITYMRHAAFSNRPETGLVGSLVANVVDLNERQSLFKEILAGNSGNEAVTHYIASDRVYDEHFVTIHTTVNKVHTWHINEVHDNYNQTTMGLYKLENNGINLVDQVISQPSWANRVTAYKNLVIATYNYATDTHESRLNIYRTD